MGMHGCIGLLVLLLIHGIWCKFESSKLNLDLIGEVADYGDFYSRNEVNIFTFLYYKKGDNYVNVINVYSLDKKNEKYEITYMFKFEHQGYCEGMIVTDWTMDGLVDALLFLRVDQGIYIVGLTQSESLERKEFVISWTSLDQIEQGRVCEDANPVLEPKNDRHYSNIHPFLCDLNGDGLIDMITQGHDGTRVVWINDGKGFIPYNWDNVPNVTFIKFNKDNQSTESQEVDLSGNGNEANEENFHITVPHSNGFVDINGDCRPDLVFTVGSDGNYKMEVWLSDVEISGKIVTITYTQMINHSLPDYPGQLIFADFNGDGSIDIGIPSCRPNENNDRCSESKFYIMFNNQHPLYDNMWKESPVKSRNPTALCTKSPFTISNYSSIKFDNSKVSGTNEFSEMNFSNFGDILRFSYGDFDSDGYPDLAFIASNVISDELSIVVYKNMLTDKNPEFQLVKYITLEEVKNNYRVSFCDIFEDGHLNVLIFGLPSQDQVNKNIFVKKTKPNESQDKGDKNSDAKESTGFNSDEDSYGSEEEEDNHTLSKNNDDALEEVSKWDKQGENKYDLTKYDIDYLPFASYKWKTEEYGLFLKASSIGPLSDIHFQDGINHETNLHGPVFMITVSDIYGKKSPRQAVQRPLSGYLPLQLPYVLFGLGKTNNYVEEFYLGMPSASQEYKNMWISIIPNCFVIVATFPLSIPSMWNLKLSINPSKKFMPILYANLACLGIIGLFIIVFHAKEKREDSEQERGFKQKFIAH